MGRIVHFPPIILSPSPGTLLAVVEHTGNWFCAGEYQVRAKEADVGVMAYGSSPSHKDVARMLEHCRKAAKARHLTFVCDNVTGEPSEQFGIRHDELRRQAA